MEQQLKKAEAAERRRIQVEKAARESEVCFLFVAYFHLSCLEFCGSSEVELTCLMAFL